MKKFKKLPFKFLILSVIVGLLLTISIGFSIWLITDRILIEPELEVGKVITQYLDGQETTYKPDTIQLPGAKALGWNQNSEDLTYSFVKVDDFEEEVNDNDFDPVTKEYGPQNAGLYKIKVIYKYSDVESYSKILNFKINKATIDMSDVKFKDVASETNIKTVTYDRNVHMFEIDLNTIPEEITGVNYKCDGVVFAGAKNVKYDVEGNVIPYEIIISFSYDKKNYNDVMDIPVKLTINPKNISDTDIVIGFTDRPNNKFYYTNSSLLDQIEGTFYVKYGIHSLTKGTEYDVTFTNTILINDYSEKVKGIGNYCGETTINYSIVKSVLTLEISQDKEIYNSVNEQYYFEYTGTSINFNDYITVKNSANQEVSADISYRYKRLGNSEYTSIALLPTEVNVYDIEITAAHIDYDSVVKVIQLRIKPIDISKGIITLEDKKLTYDGTAQTVGITNVVVGETTLVLNRDYEIITYDNNTDATGFTNDKKASVTISGKGNYEGTLTAYYSIAQRTPSFTAPTFSTNNIIEGEYPTETNSGIAQFNNNTLSGNIVSTFNSVKFTAGENSSEDITVTFTFIPNDTNENGFPNYTEAIATKEFTLYAVAYNSVTQKYYGTIKDALLNANDQGKIWVLSNIYETTGFYPTINETVNIDSGVTLIISFDSENYGTSDGYKIYSNKENFPSTNDEYAASLPKGRPARLLISDTGELNVYGTLTVGGYVSYDSTSLKEHAGVLMNNGTITLFNNAETKAYGYIKGTGTFIAKGNSIVRDLLKLYDNKGARYIAGMYFKKYGLFRKTYNNIFPFNSYSLHNIACKLKIYDEAKYFARTQLNISNKIYLNDICMFGKGGMFELTTTGGYVEREVSTYSGKTDFKTNWNDSVQEIEQKEIYKFYSSVEDNQIKIPMSILDIINFDISTGENLAMPIGMMEIILSGTDSDGTPQNYIMEIKSNSYKFLPGSKVTIERNATLKINSKYKIIFYDQYYDNFISKDKSGVAEEPHASYCYYAKHTFLYNNDKTVNDEYVSKLVVKGNVICGGYLGGIIESYDPDATISLSNDYAKLNKLTEVKEFGSESLNIGLSGIDFGGKVEEDTQYPRMKLSNGTSFAPLSNVSKGSYQAVIINGEYGWLKK